jgi:hypothetical protein
MRNMIPDIEIIKQSVGDERTPMASVPRMIVYVQKFEV